MSRQSRPMQWDPVPYALNDKQPKIKSLPTIGESSTDTLYE